MTLGWTGASSNRGSTPCVVGCVLVRRAGRFRLPPEGIANEISSHCKRQASSLLLKFYLSNSQLPSNASRRTHRFAPCAVTLGRMAFQDFVSTSVLSEVEKSVLIDVEPPFEHLLRDVGIEEGTIFAHRHCRINDRE